MAKRTSRKAKRSSRRRTSRRNGYGRGYAADPRWITARFDGIDDEGNKVRKGDEVLYWPSTKRVQTGQKAKDAWRRFLSEKGDEEGTPFASNPRAARPGMDPIGYPGYADQVDSSRSLGVPPMSKSEYKRAVIAKIGRAAWDEHVVNQLGRRYVEGTGKKLGANGRKRTSRRNASFDQTYYVRMDPEDVWKTYHLPVSQEMVLHAPRSMKVSARMTLPEARKVVRWYLADPAQPFDRLEIARFAGTGWVGKSFVSMLEEQWGRRPKKGGGFTISQYQGLAGYRRLRGRKSA